MRINLELTRLFSIMLYIIHEVSSINTRYFWLSLSVEKCICLLIVKALTDCSLCLPFSIRPFPIPLPDDELSFCFQNFKGTTPSLWEGASWPRNEITWWIWYAALSFSLSLSPSQLRNSPIIQSSYHEFPLSVVLLLFHYISMSMSFLCFFFSPAFIFHLDEFSLQAFISSVLFPSFDSFTYISFLFFSIVS